MPNSPPAAPTIARSRITSGAIVSVSPIAGSATLRSHTISPVALLMAISRPSRVTEITLSFHSATPRLLTPQQATSPAQARSVPGSIFHLNDAAPAAAHVDRVDRAPAVGDVHHAVLDDRRALQIAELVAAAALEAAERDAERQLEVLDVVGVDVLERREAVAGEVAVMQQPVLRLLVDAGARGRTSCRRRARA